METRGSFLDKYFDCLKPLLLCERSYKCKMRCLRFITCKLDLCCPVKICFSLGKCYSRMKELGILETSQNSECRHLQRYVAQDDGGGMHQLTNKIFVNNLQDAASTTCDTCNVKSQIASKICLHCTECGCDEHIKEHAKTKKHALYIDILYGEVYCTKCETYIYSKVLEDIRRANALEGNKPALQLAWPNLYIGKNGMKAKKMALSRLKGLRPLINYSSTCFVNSLMQVLIHTPALREHFMLQHESCCSTPRYCIFRVLYKEFYDAINPLEPINLCSFLRTIWPNIYSVGQQDVHEFFGTTLEAIHEHCSTERDESSVTVNQCSCIIDTVFNSVVYNKVICLKCQNVSARVELMKDFGLDLVSAGPFDSGLDSLEDCLKYFVRIEPLGPEGKIFCNNCQSNQESTREMTIKTLPIVFCFQLKRYQYLNDTWTKISRNISFPEILDVTPYMTTNNESPLPYENKYVLFGVITHLGSTTKSGHYISYIRNDDCSWYRCSDEYIAKVPLEEVLKTQAYLLFYHKYCIDSREFLVD